jgi:hypothetical protein
VLAAFLRLALAPSHPHASQRENGDSVKQSEVQTVLTLAELGKGGALAPVVVPWLAETRAGRGRRFSGALDDRRPLPVELVHQHMDVDLVHAGLHPAIDALTFFVG